MASLEKSNNHNRYTKKMGLLFAVALILFSVFASLLQTTSASAAIKHSEQSRSERLLSWEYARLVAWCYNGDSHVENNAEKVSGGQLFYNDALYVAVFSPSAEVHKNVGDFGDDYIATCGANEGELTKKAFANWQISALDLVCAMGYKRSTEGQGCKTGSSNFHGYGGVEGKDNRISKFKTALKNLTGIDLNATGDDVKYLFAREIVVNVCTTGKPGATDATGSSRYELKEIVDGKQVTSVYTGGKQKTDKVMPWEWESFPIYGSQFTSGYVTCQQALTNANTTYTKYVQVLQDEALTEVCKSLGYRNISAQPHGSYELTACKNGFNNRDNPAYCATTYQPKTYTYYGATLINSQEVEKSACEAGFKIDPETMEASFNSLDSGNTDPPTQDLEATSCGIDGIGWVVCPVIGFMASVTDFAFNFIADTFLQVRPDTVAGAQDSWSIMRNLANIAFVIVFLIIIFSQLTSFGLANYGIKKMLPKLMIAAILVNVSFFICQIAVDLSNIAGKSVYDVFGLVSSDSHDTNVDNANPNIIGGWATILVGAGGILAAGVGLALSISVPVLLAALLAVLMIVLILLVRIALIVLLTVISPLAFVAYLLPNTEHLFKKWLKTYTSLLLVYPIIGAVFGAGTLAAGILAASGDQIMQIVAMGVAVVPFFIVPGLLKGSLNAVGSIGTKLSSMSSKAGSRIGSKVGSTTALGALGRSRQLGASRRQARVQGALARAIPGKAGRRMVATGQAAAIQGEQEDIKMEQAALQKEIDASKAANPNFDSDGHLMSKAVSGSKSQRAAAMHMLAGAGRDKAIRQLQSNPDADKAALQRAVSANGGSLAAKAPDLVKGPNAAFGSVSGEDLSKFSADTGRAYMEHLQGLHAKASAPGATQADQQALADATTSFNSAVEDISNNPTLQAAFSGDTGANILKAVKGPAVGPATAFQAYAESKLGSVAGFNDNGKIR